MKKLLVVILIVSMFTLSLAGCAECLNTEHKEVEVTIVDAYYRSGWVQPIISGKVISSIYHPDQHKITVGYDGKEYTIDDEDTYKKFKDKIGQTTTGILEIRTYGR